MNKKTIGDYKEDYLYYTGKASELNRKMALGGIVLVLIFEVMLDNSLLISRSLLVPLGWFGLVFVFDLLHYVSGGLIWLIFYRLKEFQIDKKLIQQNLDIKAPTILPFILHVLYWGKLVVNSVAYYFLIKFLY